MEPGLDRRRRLAFAVLLALLAMVTVEGVSAAAILLTRRLLDEPIRRTGEIFAEQTEGIRRLLDPRANNLLVIDSVLGWRYRSNYRSSTNETNSLGLRSTREYSSTPAAGVLRVAAFGDSFVYGNEVDNSHAWSAVVEQAEPRVEVLNYGVGGYGLDQAYLRYLSEGATLKPSIVLIGFVFDDLGRLVNVYRRFRSSLEIPLTKPRYLLGPSGGLELIPSPVRRPSDYVRYLHHPRDVVAWGQHDQWFEPIIYANPMYDWSATARLLSAVWIRTRRRYFGSDRLLRGGVINERCPAFKLQVGILEEFADAVRVSGAVPVVVFLPNGEDLSRSRRGELTAVQPLMDALRARRIDYLDAKEPFLAEPASVDARRWFMSGGHYSPAGNRLVALWLGKRLREIRAPVDVAR